jgi:hypothetical protein
MNRTGNSVANSVHFDHAIRSCVVHLFFASRPFAVIGGVSQIVVLSINRVSIGGRISHISCECNELAPFITHSNSTSSVVLKHLRMGIRTALNHVLPDVIEPSPMHTVFSLALLTPTATGFSRAQVRYVHSLYSSTVALHLYIGRIAWTVGGYTTEDNQTIDPIARNEFRLHIHRIIRHDVFRNTSHSS